MPSPRLGFARANRLLSSSQFAATMKHGARSRDNFFTVYAVPNAMPQPRIGLTVSRRVATRAVVRNWVKRQVREAFRAQRPAHPPLDIVVIAQSPAAAASPQALRESLAAHWARLEVLCAR